MNIRKRVKSGFEILILIIIGIFAKIQHFQSKSLKSYQEMVRKMESNITTCWSTNFKVKITE